MLISNRHFKSPVYWANAKLAKPLASLIEEGNYDIVVMPHLYPAETITYMKKHNMLPVKQSLSEPIIPASLSGGNQLRLLCYSP